MSKTNSLLIVIGVFMAGVFFGKVTHTDEPPPEQEKLRESNLPVSGSRTRVDSSWRSDEAGEARQDRGVLNAASSLAVPPDVLPDLSFKTFQGKDNFAELQLSAALIFVLNLTSAEAAHVDSLLHSLDEGMREIERRSIGKEVEAGKYTDVTRRSIGFSADATALVIPPFAAEAAPIRDAFESSLTDAIGADRARVLLDRTVPDLEMRFGRFGEAQRTILVELPSPDDASTSEIKVAILIEDPIEDGFKTKTTSGTFEILPYAFEHLFSVDAK